jgi:hypothetical protein
MKAIGEHQQSHFGVHECSPRVGDVPRGPNGEASMVRYHIVKMRRADEPIAYTPPHSKWKMFAIAIPLHRVVKPSIEILTCTAEICWKVGPDALVSIGDNS